MSEKTKNFREEKEGITKIVLGAFERGFEKRDGFFQDRKILGFIISYPDRAMNVYRATGSVVLDRKMKLHELEEGYDSVVNMLNARLGIGDDRYSVGESP